MSMEESISLEETNKIRISLGLAPLTEDAEPANDKDKEAEDNYAKQRDQESKQRESKKIQDRIAKIKNRRELNASLKGATLGDADGDEDTLKWIKKSKKREKELAQKRLAELENMDKMFQGDDYTERDLVGLKVSHDFEDMDEGDARILTLKDSRILDNEEDELQNVEMAEAERTKKNNELKIKKRDYTGYDDEEFVPGHEGMKRSVLSKYDEDIDGVQETGFRLGNSVQTKAAKLEEKKFAAAAVVNKSLLSIDYAKTFSTSDYLQEGDVGFKKPKTKKKRSSRRVPETEPVPEDQMDVDQKPIVPRERNLDTNFVDDDDLQAALARSRKAKLHKAAKMTPEQLAKKIAEQRAQEEAEAMEVIKVEEADEDGEAGSGGLTFDDTSEFVRVVGMVKEEPKEPSVARSKQPSQSRDVSMAPGDQAIQELEAGEVEMKEEESDDEQDDAAILDAIEDLMKSVEAEQAGPSQFGAEDDGIGGTASEQTFRAGLAGTVNILRQQGVLAKPADEQEYREKVQIDRDRWLAQQRLAIEKRETDKWQSRGMAKDQAQREQMNRQREQQEVRDTVELFKSYKPDVNLVYYDEYGRSMTPKEAWKALSHRFHGKGSGKMKTEKRLKKIKDEEKQQSMSSGDTPLSMTKAFQMRQEKTGQAHMVLSVGNRGAVPQAAEFFDAQPLGKGNKGEKGKKKKEGKGAPAAESGFMTLPAPQVQSLISSANASPVPSGIDSGSPAPKPGFSRISSAVDSPSQTGPDGGERSKVTIGFGVKRKAGEDLQETPPTKRR
ncbi:SART-1 family-domain-containing protein [Roridomyces roridus]|uniref:SART-1 family-domain-containing protein n=1 Tax=Roridomyces roridus TaxID=1738132 RepID=A0AAD7CIY2_9AGAR|nr:SART-1 family-domain-containing protein [Roridomyces roridus]